MADKKPIKATFNGSDTNGLAEFTTADTIGVVDGGTGIATIGSNQLLTGDGTSALTSEANLTFNGSTLAVTGAITASGVVTGATLAGTISTVAQNSVTSASSLATVGTITSGTWSADLAMRVGAPMKILVDASTTWTLGWWKSTDNRWWLLGNTADVSSFTRADAEFYIPTGDIADVPSS